MNSLTIRRHGAIHLVHLHEQHHQHVYAPPLPTSALRLPKRFGQGVYYQNSAQIGSKELILMVQ